MSGYACLFHAKTHPHHGRADDAVYPGRDVFRAEVRQTLIRKPPPVRESSRSQNDGGRFRAWHFLWVAGLLVLPGCAVYRAAGPVGLGYAGGWCAAASLFAFLACRRDKRSARAETWRTPEGTLHLLELLGGWPGSFLAQRRFRHKTVKASYQAAFWLIVGLHQLVAIDALRGWPLVHLLARTLKDVVSR